MSEKWPNLYEQNKNVGDYSTLSKTQLDGMRQEYAEFVDREDIQPRARDTAMRILSHIAFELDYRDGIVGP